DFHPAKLGLPTVERRRADPVLAAHLGGRKPGLLLAQHRNDLLFREPRSLHRPVLPSGRTLASSGGNNGGHSNPSSSTVRTVDRGSFGPVRRSATDLRAFHLAMVFGLT